MVKQTLVCNLRGGYLVNLPKHVYERAFVWSWDLLHDKDSDVQGESWCPFDDIVRKIGESFSDSECRQDSEGGHDTR